MSKIKAYTKKDGKKYFMFKLYIGVDPLTGKEQYTTRRGFTSSKSAEIALGRLQQEIKDGRYKKQSVETYQDIYDLWITQYENTVEESTFIKTIGIFRNHILPAMGLYKIDRINVDVCESHVNEWAFKLKNYRMVKSYAAKVLDFAIKRGFIQNNPFTLVEMPRNFKKIHIDEEDTHENFYTKDQLIRFLKCMEQETNYKAYVFFRFLAFSGCRKSELLALTWRDIDFKNNEIRINKAVKRGSSLYLGSTKTRKPRTIKMDQETMGILKKWKKQQKEDLSLLGFNTTQPKQLVFSNEENKYLQPTKSRKWLEHVLNKYNLPKITTHGFRHTHTSLLFEAGASIKEVQDRLGHSDVKTTMNIYAHVSKQAKDEAINKLTNFLKFDHGFDHG